MVTKYLFIEKFYLKNSFLNNNCIPYSSLIAPTKKATDYHVVFLHQLSSHIVWPLKTTFLLAHRSIVQTYS